MTLSLRLTTVHINFDPDDISKWVSTRKIFRITRTSFILDSWKSKEFILTYFDNAILTIQIKTGLKLLIFMFWTRDVKISGAS